MARKSKAQRKQWTPEDNELLLEYAGEMTARQIAEQLGRSPGAVQQKLYKLRQNGSHNDSHASEEQTAQVAPDAERVASIMHFVERAIAHGWRVEIPEMGVTIN